ncbi:hypothetical protein HFN53_16955 [Rhizobium leguminosarum]|nr:hypothetical protein [Rhizobium leguminosarum]
MFSTCVVDTLRNEELSGRNLVPTVQHGLALVRSSTAQGISGEMYWAVSDDQAAALAGIFTTRSAAWAFPDGCLRSADAEFTFSGAFAKKRMGFALEVLADAQRQEAALGEAVTLYNHSSLWNHYSSIPDEDFEWANAEIRARMSGSAPVPHPDPEVGFMVWLIYTSNTLDQAELRP